MTAVLLDHASQGDLIYHGHVGHLLLSSIPHVLKVRVIADLEYRIQAAMKQVNLTREAALAHIRKVDEERSRWARLLYGADWEDQTQYHLVVNLGWLSVASASEAVIRLSEMAEFRPTLEGMAGYEDLRLSCRVWGALAKNPQTRNAGIQVTAHGGEIVVSGNVPSGKTLEVLPRIAGQVEGVRSVRCEAGMGTDWYW
jgi:osmotically-inducible protein OsmY